MRVLVVDDDPGVLLALEFLFRREGIAFTCVASPSAARDAAGRQHFDVALLDLNYTKDTTSGAEGLSLLALLRSEHPRTPLVVMTGWATIEGAVSAMRCGASDYLPKPWENERLVALLRRFDPGIQKGAPNAGGEGLVSASPAMQGVLWTVERVAHTDVPILITGEHGTGKEVLARRIHARSARRGAFVALNAGALPEGIVESELFGHVRGAFTDAKTDRPGAFGLAQDGTIFLDEVANMALSQQAKLLRVLQEQCFVPLGGSVAVRSTARVISATNADVGEETRKGALRADLLYRLNTIHVHIPPLRERREEIPGLAAHFVREASARYGTALPVLSEGAGEALLAHAWAGNVRSLEHVMQRAVLLSTSHGKINEDHLQLSRLGTPSAPPRGGTVKEVERSLVLAALERYPEDRVAAAKSLGLSRSAFYRRLQQLGVKLRR